MNEEKQPGAWVITRVYSKHGIPIDVKSSGNTTAAAIDDLYSGIAHGIEKYGWMLEQANAPKPQPKEQSAAPSNSPVTAKAGESSVDTSVNTLEVVKVRVTPKPDDKVELQLFGEGHQYADLYHNGTVKQVLAALTATGLVWDESHLKVASEFTVKFYADWRNSEKMNGKGKPYKNIIQYRAVDAVA